MDATEARLRELAARLYDDGWYAADVNEGHYDSEGPPLSQEEAVERFMRDLAAPAEVEVPMTERIERALRAAITAKAEDV